MILLAIGIKAAFPVCAWLKDGYAGDSRGPVWLCALPQSALFVCRPLVSGAEVLIVIGGGHGDVSHFLCCNRE